MAGYLNEGVRMTPLVQGKPPGSNVSRGLGICCLRKKGLDLHCTLCSVFSNREC